MSFEEHESKTSLVTDQKTQSSCDTLGLVFIHWNHAGYTFLRWKEENSNLLLETD